MNAADWRTERERALERARAIGDAGGCFICDDLVDGSVFGDQPVVYDDDDFRVVLDRFPRAKGHTLVFFKPHRRDVADLSEEETASLFVLCGRVMHALRDALGAEQVYMYTMCDGAQNHAHLQLLPRYPGQPQGSTRFVAVRSIITDGQALAQRIAGAMSRGAGQLASSSEPEAAGAPRRRRTVRKDQA